MDLYLATVYVLGAVGITSGLLHRMHQIANHPESTDKSRNTTQRGILSDINEGSSVGESSYKSDLGLMDEQSTSSDILSRDARLALALEGVPKIFTEKYSSHTAETLNETLLEILRQGLAEEHRFPETDESTLINHLQDRLERYEESIRVMRSAMAAVHEKSKTQGR